METRSIKAAIGILKKIRGEEVNLVATSRAERAMPSNLTDGLEARTIAIMRLEARPITGTPIITVVAQNV